MRHESLALSLVYSLMVIVGCQPNPSPSTARPQPPANVTLKKTEQGCLSSLKARMIKGDFSFTEVSNPLLNNEVKNIKGLAAMPSADIEYILNRGGQNTPFTSVGVVHSKKDKGNLSKQEISLSVPDKNAEYLYTLTLSYSIEAVSGRNTTLNQKFKVDSHCQPALSKTGFTQTTFSDSVISAVHFEESAEEKSNPFRPSESKVTMSDEDVLLNPESFQSKLTRWNDIYTFITSIDGKANYYSRTQDAPYFVKVNVAKGLDTEQFDPLLGQQTQFYRMNVGFENGTSFSSYYSKKSDFRFIRFSNGMEKWIVNSVLFGSTNI